MDLVERLRGMAGWSPSEPTNGNGRHDSSAESSFNPALIPPTLFEKDFGASGGHPPSTPPELSGQHARADVDAEPDSDESSPGPDNQNVVHHVLKGLDVWFKIEVSGLEREATHQAVSWAERGLPRHDLDTAEALDVEQVLAHRANEVYWTWIRKARRRIDAAISRENRRISDALERATVAFDAYRGIERALSELSPRKPAAKADPPQASAITLTTASDDVARLAERSLHWWFWPLSLGLIVAEFIANAPIFTELFPSSLEIETRVNDWLINDKASVVWLGLRKLGIQLLASPEPAILALAIVTFFLFLGHSFGESARTWVVARRAHPLISDRRRSELVRQARPVAVACALGIMITVAVLFWARHGVQTVADQRLVSASGQVTAAEEALTRAQQESNDTQITDSREKYWRALDERDHRVRRAEYAASISRLNWPILGLNVVLVIVATVAGYFRSDLVVKRDCGDEAPAAALVPAEVVDLKPRLALLRCSLAERRSEIAGSIDRAELSYARAQLLVHCDPTAQHEAFAERLRSVVSLFRAENAKARCLDTRDIRAFQKPPASLQLEAPVRPKTPTELLDLAETQRQRLDELIAASHAIGATTRPIGREAPRETV